MAENTAQESLKRSKKLTTRLRRRPSPIPLEALPKITPKEKP